MGGGDALWVEGGGWGGDCGGKGNLRGMWRLREVDGGCGERWMGWMVGRVDGGWGTGRMTKLSEICVGIASAGRW